MTEALVDVLLPWAQSKRWWPADSTQSAQVVGQIPLEVTNSGTVLTVLMMTDSPALVIQVPLLLVPLNSDEEASQLGDKLIGFVGGYAVLDGTADSAFWRAWIRRASVVSRLDQDEDATRSELLTAASTVQPLGVEQSNTSVLFLGGEKPLIAKLFRILHPGTHPEVELPLALGDWEGVPRLNAFHYLEDRQLAGSCCSAVITDAVQQAEDGAVKLRAMCLKSENAASVACEMGSLIAHMHNRLEASLESSSGPSMAELRVRLNQTIRDTLAVSDALSADEVSGVLRMIEQTTEEETAPAPESEAPSKAIRVHGDLHLGQLLLGDDGRWNVVDFEGEPLRSLSERNLPDSPARDIAGMLRSFDYAAESSGNFDEAWLAAARSAFLEGYRSQRSISPTDARMIQAFELEKALYEMQYEVQFRPDWVRIPLNGIQRLLADQMANDQDLDS